MDKRWNDYDIDSYVCFFTQLHPGLVSEHNDMGYHGRVIYIDENKMKVEVSLEQNIKIVVDVCRETVELSKHNNIINVTEAPTLEY